MGELATRFLKKGEVLFREGEAADNAYVVKTGNMRVSKTGNSGRRVTIATVSTGGIVGEMALVDDQPRYATVSALEDTEVVLIKPSHFEDAITSMNPFMTAVVKMVMGRLRDTSDTTVALFERVDKATRAKTDAKPRKSFGKRSFESVDLVILDENSQTRYSMKSGFFASGFRNVTYVQSLAAVARELHVTGTDLVVLDSDIGFKETCQQIREIREGLIGPSPFVPIIVMHSDLDDARTRELLEAGCDRVLGRPFSLEDLTGLIRSIAIEDREFVITSDYTGPEHVGHASAGVRYWCRMMVPNPLRDKMAAQKPDEERIAELKRACGTLACLKMEQQRDRILWLLEKLEPEKEDRSSTDHYQRLLEQTFERFVKGIELTGDKETAAIAREILAKIRKIDPESPKRAEIWTALRKQCLSLDELASVA